MKFLCGCDQDDPYVKNYHPHLVMVNGRQQLTTKTHNQRGQEVCPIHGRPLAIDSIRKPGPQGNEIPDFHAEYLARYGTHPRGSLGTPGIEDRRENSDPTTIGATILKERAAERAISNGKAERDAA